MRNLTYLLQNILANPPKLWQLLFFVSFGLWIMATRVDPELQELLAILGLMTLITSLWIVLTSYPVTYFKMDFKVPIIWLLVCILASIKLEGVYEKILWMTYPEVIGLSIVLPDFTIKKFKFQTPSRSQLQKDTVLLLSCLLITCWIYFSFVLNGWANDPSQFGRKDMSKSLFVVKLDLGKLR